MLVSRKWRKLYYFMVKCKSMDEKNGIITNHTAQSYCVWVNTQRMVTVQEQNWLTVINWVLHVHELVILNQLYYRFMGKVLKRKQIVDIVNVIEISHLKVVWGHSFAADTHGRKFLHSHIYWSNWHVWRIDDNVIIIIIQLADTLCSYDMNIYWVTGACMNIPSCDYSTVYACYLLPYILRLHLQMRLLVIAWID